MDVAPTGGGGDLLDLKVMKIKVSKPVSFSLLRGSAETQGPLRSHFPSGWDAIFKAWLPPSNSGSMCLHV